MRQTSRMCTGSNKVGAKLQCFACFTCTEGATRNERTSQVAGTAFLVSLSPLKIVSYFATKLPVGPHKAVAEISKIGNYRTGEAFCCDAWKANRTDEPQGAFPHPLPLPLPLARSLSFSLSLSLSLPSVSFCLLLSVFLSPYLSIYLSVDLSV